MLESKYTPLQMEFLGKGAHIYDAPPVGASRHRYRNFWSIIRASEQRKFTLVAATRQEGQEQFVRNEGVRWSRTWHTFCFVRPGKRWERVIGEVVGIVAY